jgi:hypothetical protein
LEKNPAPKEMTKKNKKTKATITTKIPNFPSIFVYYAGLINDLL